MQELAIWSIQYWKARTICRYQLSTPHSFSLLPIQWSNRQYFLKKIPTFHQIYSMKSTSAWTHCLCFASLQDVCQIISGFWPTDDSSVNLRSDKQVTPLRETHAGRTKRLAASKCWLLYNLMKAHLSWHCNETSDDFRIHNLSKQDCTLSSRPQRIYKKHSIAEIQFPSRGRCAPCQIPFISNEWYARYISICMTQRIVREFLSETVNAQSIEQWARNSCTRVTLHQLG